MARRATAIKQERSSETGIVLVLDAGNTLTGRWLTEKSEGAIMVEAMNAMGYDAMVVGEIDMSLGLDALKKREREAKFGFLSANIVSVSDKELLFAPYMLLERQGKRIAIIGISDLDAARSPAVKDSATVLDPVQAARDYVRELRPQADLVVVLSRLGLDNDLALAQAVPGIDVIIGGNTRKLMPQPERVGNTLIMQQGYLGEWIGVLQATYGAGEPTAVAGRIVTLGPDYSDDPDIVALVQGYVEQYPTPTQAAPAGAPNPAPTKS